MSQSKSNQPDAPRLRPPDLNQADLESQPTFPPSCQIRGVALDMDGLLFDTEGLYWEVGDTVLQRRGYRYSKELQTRMMGRVGVAALEQMVDFHHLQDTPESLLEESDRLFSEKLERGVPLIAGVPEWIDFLKQQKIPFGLATSSRRCFVDILFQTIGWQDDLAFVLTGDDVQQGKPHPEMYLRAADQLSLAPSQMLVLEDSGNGCSAAVAAGACTVAIPSIHTQDQNFEGAVLIAESIRDPRLWSMIQPLP